MVDSGDVSPPAISRAPMTESGAYQPLEKPPQKLDSKASMAVVSCVSTMSMPSQVFFT
jgi:hypothetical protein